MKYITLLLLFVVPIFAAEPTVAEKEVPKDFTSLLIEKTDKYSDKAIQACMAPRIYVIEAALEVMKSR